MSGIGQNFTEEQIRALISSLHIIGEKNSGSIPVNSLNEASEITAYISGFKSWKDLRQSLRKKNGTLDNYKHIEHPKHINHFDLLKQAQNSPQMVISFSPEKFEELDKKLKLPKIKFSQDIGFTVKDIEQMATGHLIVGSVFDTELKYEKLFHLNPQNTLCISSSPLFFDNICEQAYLKKKHTIHFSHTPHALLSHEKDFVKLDPLNEIYCSDHFDVLFELDFDNINGFDLLWSLLVKNHCQTNNYIINTNILKNFLSLDFLTTYAIYIKKNKNPLSRFLDNYLLSLNIKKENTNIIYQKEDVIQHIQNIQNIYKNVMHIEEMYVNGTFAYQSHQLMNDFIKRDCVCVYTPFHFTDYVAYIYNQTLDYCATKFDSICESKNYSHTHYNSLIINSNPKLFNLSCLYNKNYTYHLRINYNFENQIMPFFQQIIFSQIDGLESPNKDWLIKFFLFTPDTINIFALGNKLLREIDTNTAFLWKTNDKHPVLAQDNFIISKINIYNPSQKFQKIQ